jgi:hypothetical protein
VYVLINWLRACPRSVYLRIQEIKSPRVLLKTFYHVTDCWRMWPRSVFSSATDVNHTFASVWLVMIQNILNTFNFLYAQINWSRARPQSVYQHIHEIKSTLNITCRMVQWKTMIQITYKIIEMCFQCIFHCTMRHITFVSQPSVFSFDL